MLQFEIFLMAFNRKKAFNRNKWHSIEIMAFNRNNGIQ